MKKCIYSIVMIIVGIIFTTDVKAFDIDYGIYCQYGEYFFLYSGTSREDIFYLNQNFDGGEFSDVPSLGISIEANRPGISLFEFAENADGVKYQPELQWLQNNGLLDSEGNFTCPTNPFGTTLGTFTKKECGASGCFIVDVPTSYESYTCNYKSSSGNQNLIIDYSYNETYINGKWDITYPDGTMKTFIGTEINGNFMPSSDCADIYYIPSEKRIQIALPANEGISNNPTLAGLCEKYQISEIEHYCSGDCQYAEMVCSTDDYKTVSCGGSTAIPAALPTFIRNIVNIIKIGVPIILIIMGMLDFGRAMMSNGEKEMKESQNRFVKRLIGAVAVFLVVAITQLIFNLIGTDSTNEMAACINCFLNNKCSVQVPATQTSKTACYQCTSDSTKYLWTSSNPGATSVCPGGYNYVNLSEEECKSKYMTYSCYQCNGNSNIYSWTTNSGSDDACPSGYHIRTDKTTKGSCKA